MASIEIIWSGVKEEDEGILSARELRSCRDLKGTMRRQEFIAGRRLFKGWFAARDKGFGDVSLHANSREEKPVPFRSGRTIDGLDVSLAHSNGAVVLAAGVGCRVGVDMEGSRLIRYPDRFLEKIGTAKERRQIFLLSRGSPARLRKNLLTLWMAKEAGLKLAGRGLRWNPKTLECDLRTHTATDGEGRGIIYWRRMAIASCVICVASNDQAALQQAVVTTPSR